MDKGGCCDCYAPPAAPARRLMQKAAALKLHRAKPLVTARPDAAQRNG